jgi:hypothetical protein
MAMVSRRTLEIILGCLWLLDGALQFQPFMFSKEFFQGILGMANMGLPGPVAHADFWVASLLVAHPAVWNAVFASLQVLLGVGLLYPRTSRMALAASIPWALGVWVIGEGLGGLFMGGTSLLVGAPGAAVLYAVVAILIWPGLSPRVHDAIGRAAWMVAWLGSALLELQTINHASTVPGAQINNGRFGEPGWLAWLNATAGHAVGHRGTELAAVLGVAAALIGIGVYWSRTRLVVLWAGMALAVGLGVLGQDLGAIATGHGTDPGTGPLFILLALAIWPDKHGAAVAPRPVPARHAEGRGWTVATLLPTARSIATFASKG